MAGGESRLGLLYRRAYDTLCGRHPNLWPWHFQWLDGVYLYRGLRKFLPRLGGRILDIGCGSKPYRDWFGSVTEYVGLDVVPGKEVDVLVRSDERWPYPDGYFDVLLSSQVLEHVEHLDFTLSEMFRVLKSNGVMVLSFPFIYNEHGIPWDFQRFTAYRAQRLFDDVDILHLERQGGIGSTLGLLFLNWIEASFNKNFATRLLKGMILPFWIFFSSIVNMFGYTLDKIDHTKGFYFNLLMIVRKR